ncbi:sugar ABC transporter ATP-binding protein [Bradyrhizobium liaoningense]|uniref:sugar ABC transporter ATP-binding protein n=1 Tax=Bradyrhizobium liaoningense TaxID=43992 RepID=UPI002011510F|nr:sugar ABC transporter ATP-binding protein [Bradyrhizobium liaoningense]
MHASSWRSNGESAEVLRAHRIIKDFDGQRALDGVSLSLRAGEIHALVGQNGAGKSTLIKVLTGVYPATAGDILVRGQLINIVSPQQARLAGIEVVHQQGNLIPSLSVQENLFLGQALPRRGRALIDWKSVRHAAEALLARVGVHVDASAPVSSLRADEAAMVSIAKSLSTNAQVVILDEPTAALTPTEVEILFAQMRRLAREGHSFIFVSHRMSEIFQVADAATVLRDGRVAWSCAQRSDLSKPAVIAAILGKSEEVAPSHASVMHHRADTLRLDVRNLRTRNIAACSFTAARGEILGLAGLPDSGAEETLDSLYGRTKALADAVTLDGARLPLSSPREAARSGLAFVPKDRHIEALIPNFNVQANISVASLDRLVTDPVTRLISRRRERNLATNLASRLQVKMSGLQAPIRSLSGGNQQKCVIARWIATDAKLYLLNSPTAAVDVGAKTEIYKLLRKIADTGATVLFTSTEFDEFARVCDRVLVFCRGRIAGELSGSSISESNILHLAVVDDGAAPIPGQIVPDREGRVE